MGIFGPPNIEKMKAKKNIKGLIEALGYRKNSDMPKAAAEALRVIGAPSVELLITTLKDSDEEPDVRYMAAEVLGKIGDKRAIEPLITALKNWKLDVNVRGTVAKALGKIGDIRAIEPLIAALKDNNEYVRSRAAKALGEIGFPSVEPLCVALKDEEELMRRRAAKTLGEIGDSRAVEPLIANLKDRICCVGEAAWALARIGDQRAIDPLISALTNKDLCPFAAEALRKFGDPRAIEPLIAAMSIPKWNRKGLIFAEDNILVSFGEAAIEPLISALGNINENVRIGAIEALDVLGWKPDQGINGARYWIAKCNWEKAIDIGSPAVVPAIAAFEYEKKDPLVELLVSIGDPAISPLIAALEDDIWKIRLGAAEALGAIGNARAMAPLMVALNDESLAVRLTASESLEKLNWKLNGGEAEALYWIAKRDWEKVASLGLLAIDPLITVLKMIRSSEWTGFEIGRIKGRVAEAADLLDKIGWKPDVGEPETWYWMAKGEWKKVGNLGSTAVVPLFSALKNYSVCKEAIKALGMTGDHRSIEPLIEILKNEKGNRVSAADALQKLGWNPVGGDAETWYWIAKGDLKKLCELGSLAVEPLIAALEDINLRSTAIYALGQIGDPRAVEPLINLIRCPLSAEALATIAGNPRAKSDYWNAQEAAAKVLGMIGDPRAVKPLIAWLKSDLGDLRKAAATALVKMYREGQLSEKSKNSILAVRETIICPYGHKDYEGGGCNPKHEDWSFGIGVEFPL